jgi:hypothetical protein
MPRSAAQTNHTRNYLTNKALHHQPQVQLQETKTADRRMCHGLRLAALFCTPHSYFPHFRPQRLLYYYLFRFNMSGLECAKSVANITSSLYRVQLIIECAIERRKIETAVDSHSAGAKLQTLQHSAKDGIRRINMAYNEALRKIGPAFSDGDRMMISF